MNLTKLALLMTLTASALTLPALADPPPSAPSPPPAQPAVVPPPPPVPKPAPTSPKPAAPSSKDQPPPTTRVAANGILGRKVVGPDGQEMGRVVDVLVDAGSNPRAAVIDFGGFMGVGTRRIAVDWSDMIFPATGSGADIKIDLTADQIRNAPAYTDQTKPASVVEPPAAKPAPPPPVVAKPAPPDLSARPTPEPATPTPPEILKPATGH